MVSVGWRTIFPVVFYATFFVMLFPHFQITHFDEKTPMSVNSHCRWMTLSEMLKELRCAVSHSPSVPVWRSIWVGRFLNLLLQVLQNLTPHLKIIIWSDSNSPISVRVLNTFYGRMLRSHSNLYCRFWILKYNEWMTLMSYKSRIPMQLI